MARAFWKGTISFGLVAIPVKMYVGIESKSLSFHLLHKKCLTRPKQVLHCETDDEYFSIKDTVRGFEAAKDQYVTLSDEDLENVPIKSAHTIDILGFIEAKELDPVYFSGVHYLEPEQTGIKPFQLLIQALEKTGRVGMGKVSFQHREHLCCLRPQNGIIVLHSLHYKNEILPYTEITSPKTKITEAELNMAVALVKSMEKPFKPGDYKDEYREALQKVIDAKMKGKKIIAPAVPKAEMGDLMAELRASIEAAKKEPALSKPK
jgi:DNA end-binding protein Ku